MYLTGFELNHRGNQQLRKPKARCKSLFNASPVDKSNEFAAQ